MVTEVFSNLFGAGVLVEQHREGKQGETHERSAKQDSYTRKVCSGVSGLPKEDGARRAQQYQRSDPGESVRRRIHH